MTEFKPGDQAVYFMYRPGSRAGYRSPAKFKVTVMTVFKSKVRIMFETGETKNVSAENLEKVCA